MTDASQPPPFQGTLPLPDGYARILCVPSFDALVTTPFANGVNALCWVRRLPGDFDEVARALDARASDDVWTVEDPDLSELAPLSAQGSIAVDCLREDQALLRARGLTPKLDCIRSYPRDDAHALVATDVYSFHVDRAPFATDTYLCSYNPPASEILRNDEAIRHVDIPETRAALLASAGAQDDEVFREYLADQCFDLHYRPRRGASPVSCGIGYMWRIACLYPGAPVPPCIHRAPAMLAGQPPRLLLIS